MKYPFKVSVLILFATLAGCEPKSILTPYTRKRLSEADLKCRLSGNVIMDEQPTVISGPVIIGDEGITLCLPPGATVQYISVVSNGRTIANFTLTEKP